MAYKYAHPQEWLTEKINQYVSAGDIDQLQGLALKLSSMLDSDQIKDTFQSEMSDDGYFDKQVWTLTMSSEEFGDEEFTYDSEVDATSAYVRLLKQCHNHYPEFEREFTLEHPSGHEEYLESYTPDEEEE